MSRATSLQEPERRARADRDGDPMESDPEPLPDERRGQAAVPTEASGHESLPQWMSYPESKIEKGHGKLESLFTLQSQRLDKLEESLVKQGTATADRMQRLEKAIEGETLARSTNEDATAKTLSAIELRLAAVGAMKELRRSRQQPRTRPATRPPRRSAPDGAWLQDTMVLGNWPSGATEEIRLRKVGQPDCESEVRERRGDEEKPLWRHPGHPGGPGV